MSNGNKLSCVLILLFALLSTLPLFDPIKLYLFCIPSAAGITAPLSGGTFSLEPGMAVIQLEGLKILVPPSCSGMTFCLILAFLFPVYGKWKYCFLSYPIALAANGLRILAAAEWPQFLKEYLPHHEEFLHQGAGIVIFLSVLLIASFFLRFFTKRPKTEK